MAKTLVEMAAEIVQVQAGQTEMTSEEIARALNKTYEALKDVKATGRWTREPDSHR